MFFEHYNEELIPRTAFLKRVIKYLGLSVALILGSLLVGMACYSRLEGLSMIDAFLNSAMIMGGMGPVNTLHNDSAKIFAGIYALWCGFVELVAVAIFATPIFHRVLHHFHVEGKKK